MVSLNNDHPALKTAEMEKKNKVLKIVLLFSGAIFLLLIAYIFFDGNSLNKKYKKDLKILQAQFDSLARDRSEKDKISEHLAEEINQLKNQRQFIDEQIRYQNSQIATIKSKYEKISRYTDIGVDSLHGQFTTRFR